MHRHAGKDWASPALCEVCRLEREAEDLRRIIRDKDALVMRILQITAENDDTNLKSDET